MSISSNLLYGVNDKPPVLLTILAGLQHTFVMSSTLILPVMIISEIGGTQSQIQSVVSFTMIAAGLTTIIQFIKGPVGSGYLLPYLSGVPYFSASMKAAWIGGLPLLAGMSMIAGLFESVLSRLMRKLRFLFPAEVTGVVVLMVGVALIPLGASNFMGLETDEALFEIPHVLLGAATLAIMVILNIWGSRSLRVYCVFIGMVVGYVAAYMSGIMTDLDVSRLGNVSWFAFPKMQHASLKFDWGLMAPFLIAGLCSSLKSVGDMITCQKINDDDWKEPDMKSISNGLLAGGIGTFISGALGGLGVGSSSSNVGVSAATGATSRYIGIAAGGLFIAFACFPKITALFALMPKPVMGAILIFVTCYMITAGIQILMTVDMTIQKIFIIGISIIFGLSVDILPNLWDYVPQGIKPIFSSSMTLSTILAILLTQFFLVGDFIKRKLSKGA